MTGTKKKSKPTEPKEEDIFSELGQVQAILGATPGEVNNPSGTPVANCIVHKKLTVTHINRQLLQELEELHQMLAAELPQTPHPKTQPTKQPPTQIKDKTEQLEPAVNPKSSTAVRRGAKEVQASLFDEPLTTTQSSQATPAAKPEGNPPTTKPALKPEIDRLVDDLVARYLPSIEQRLRQEIKRLLDK